MKKDHLLGCNWKKYCREIVLISILYSHNRLFSINLQLKQKRTPIVRVTIQLLNNTFCFSLFHLLSPNHISTDAFCCHDLNFMFISKIPFYYPLTNTGPYEWQTFNMYEFINNIQCHFIVAWFLQLLLFKD